MVGRFAASICSKSCGVSMTLTTSAAWMRLAICPGSSVTITWSPKSRADEAYRFKKRTWISRDGSSRFKPT